MTVTATVTATATATEEQVLRAASADLINQEGDVVGQATLRRTEEGAITIWVEVSSLDVADGERGLHIHEVGECEPPDFTSAGGHFNPTDASHGFLSEEGPHAGDLPNIYVSDGSADYETTTKRITLVSGESAILDEDGSALVIHAQPDDYLTDPAGNSGDRIACGIITPTQLEEVEATPTPEEAETLTPTATATPRGEGAEATPTPEEGEELIATPSPAPTRTPTARSTVEAERTVTRQAQGTWTQGAPMPTARSEIAAAVLDGRIYVAGGLDTEGNPLAAFEVYDPEDDKWEVAPSMPVALHHLGVAAQEGRVYVSGGYRGTRFRPNVRGAWVYDPETERWSEIAAMPAPRAAHVMVPLDGKLYVVGGVGPEPTAVWAYDPESDSWDETLAPLPTPREHLSAAVTDGKLYVIGGRWSGIGNLDTVEVYDPATDEWMTLPAMPTPRGGLTAAALDEQIHVTGGEAFEPSRTFGEHEVYDVTRERWFALPDLPTPRHGLASIGLDGRWYVIGGGPEAGLSVSDVVEIYTVDSERS